MRLAVRHAGSTERSGACCSAVHAETTLATLRFGLTVQDRHEGVQRWRESAVYNSLIGTCDLRWKLQQHHNSQSIQWVHPAHHPGLCDPRDTCGVVRVHAVILSVSFLEAWFTMSATLHISIRQRGLPSSATLTNPLAQGARV